MSGITPERLDALRFTLQAGFRLRPRTERAIAFDLLYEVDRLRAGIEDMRDMHWVDGRRPLWDEAEDLLNPPTEGEDHD